LLGADDGAVDWRHRTRRLGRHSFKDLHLHAGPGPSIEAIVDRRVGAIAQVPPRRARTQEIEDDVQDPTVIDPCRAKALGSSTGGKVPRVRCKARCRTGAGARRSGRGSQMATGRSRPASRFMEAMAPNYQTLFPSAGRLKQ
jgi:hypothetical protein